MKQVGKRANVALQIDFQDPSQEWEICNAWFVKQSNFQTKFKVRELVKPEKETTTTT